MTNHVIIYCFFVGTELLVLTAIFCITFVNLMSWKLISFHFFALI